MRYCRKMQADLDSTLYVLLIRLSNLYYAFCNVSLINNASIKSIHTFYQC